MSILLCLRVSILSCTGFFTIYIHLLFLYISGEVSFLSVFSNDMSSTLYFT